MTGNSRQFKSENEAGSAAESGYAIKPGAYSETNHRIANNLSLVVALVRLHAAQLARERRTMTAGEASTFLDEVASRIETVASLHRLLSITPDGPEVDMIGYLRELCDTLVATLTFAGNVEISSPPCGRCMVPNQIILPVALIVTEAITNAIKYAHPTGVAGAIDVACRRDPSGALVVEVADDGVGLPDGFDATTDGGLGFHAMRLLARQVDAQLTFESAPIGTRCTLIVPARA